MILILILQSTIELPMWKTDGPFKGALREARALDASLYSNAGNIHNSACYFQTLQNINRTS
jgi:hypothetical protein